MNHIEQTFTFNNDDTVDGILVQMPVPAHIDDKAVIEAISPSKDVDGFHPMNVGSFVLVRRDLFPAHQPVLYSSLSVLILIFPEKSV